MCIESSAEGLVAGTPSTKSIDVSLDRTNMSAGNAGEENGFTLHESSNVTFDEAYRTFLHYSSLGGVLFSSSTKYYAYKIAIKASNMSRTAHQIRWQRFCVGDYSEVNSGNGLLAQSTNSNGTSTLWYVTDYASKPMYIGVLTYAYYYSASTNAGSGTIKDYYADWNTTGHIDVTITPYSEAGYMKEIADNTTETNNKLDESNKIAEETQKTTKGIFSSITDFFGSFFQNLIDSVIGLFVPSSEEMSGLFDQLNQFFSDRFGFLYAPFDYMVQLLGVFTSAEGSTGLTFPGFSIMGYEVWSDLTYDLASDELVGTILEYVRIGTGILLGGWFIMYLQDFFKERFSK